MYNPVVEILTGGLPLFYRGTPSLICDVLGVKFAEFKATFTPLVGICIGDGLHLFGNGGRYFWLFDVPDGLESAVKSH